MFAVSFIPIFIAGFVTVALGWFWYHPKMFGTSWADMSGMSPELLEMGKRNMPMTIFYALLAAWLVAYVMSYFAIAWQVFDWISAIELAFWLWLGFVAPAMLGSVLWEQRPFKLYLINTGFWFFAFCATSVIIVLGMGFSSGVNAAYDTQGQAQTVSQ